jgi:hypothetical protein
MIIFRFKDSKIMERWEIIDILSAAKQLAAKQQLCDKECHIGIWRSQGKQRT